MLLSDFTDLRDISSVLVQDPQPLRLDHCDLLLDAIDVELGQLQVCDFPSACLYCACVTGYTYF